MSSEDRRQLIEDEMERIADEMERMAAGFEILVVREGHVMGGTIPDAGEESHASEIGHENAVAEGVSAMQESTEADGGQEDHTDDTGMYAFIERSSVKTLTSFRHCQPTGQHTHGSRCERRRRESPSTRANHDRAATLD